MTQVYIVTCTLICVNVCLFALFVVDRYLERGRKILTPKPDKATAGISPETVAKLKKFSVRELEDVDPDPNVSYKNGLSDGVTMAALFVLAELKEKSNGGS